MAPLCEQHALRGGGFPIASTTYRSVFGPVRTYPALDPATIRVSWAPDRSNPTTLAAKSLSGKVYVFTEPGLPVRRISFYLDDMCMSRPPHSAETYAPYDFAGGTVGTAFAFDSSTLLTGGHTLTVAVDTGTSTMVGTAPFVHYLF